MMVDNFSNYLKLGILGKILNSYCFDLHIGIHFEMLCKESTSERQGYSGQVTKDAEINKKVTNKHWNIHSRNEEDNDTSKKRNLNHIYEFDVRNDESMLTLSQVRKNSRTNFWLNLLNKIYLDYLCLQTLVVVQFHPRNLKYEEWKCLDFTLQFCIFSFYRIVCIFY